MIETQSGAPQALNTLHQWHTVLIVDDDPETLSALRRALAREPYDVVTTSRPSLALEWIERKNVSLVISDQKMPEMTGDHFLDGVWKKSPWTAQLMLTGYPESVKIAPHVRKTLLRLMTKPWDEMELKRTIRDLLHERESAVEGAVKP